MSDELRDYREPSYSIYIPIDPESNNAPNISMDGRSNNEQPPIMSSYPARRLHSMFNSVRQHVSLNHVETRNELVRNWILNPRLPIQGFQSGQTSHGFRYTPLINSNSSAAVPSDNVHILLNSEHQRTQDQMRSPLNMLRGRLERDTANVRLETQNSTQSVRNERSLGTDTNTNNTNQIENRIPFDNDGQPPAASAQSEDDNNNNVFSDILVRVLGNFIRYLPFLIILFVKFIHDHLIGILDIAILQAVMYFVNKSLNQQAMKLSHKNTWILIRDMGMVAATITYRFLLASSSIDPFGLMINPPAETLTIEVSSTAGSSSSGQSAALNLLKNYVLTPSRSASDADSALHATKALSLGLLIYYVVVNDLILKLMTIWIKIVITLLPHGLLRRNQRARSYVLVEYSSQFYRSLVPIRQWVTFFFECYTGLEVASGVLFAAFYIGAKGFELASRGNVLREAFVNFVRNMDYERKPTKAELEAAGLMCPICHDSYNTPVVLSCNHIFCDECVGQWFKREQTCPVCRAKVSDDPLWQNGSTTFFYQLC